MSARPPARLPNASSRRLPDRSWRWLLPVCALSPLALAGALQLELPLPNETGAVVIGSSPQIEVAALADALKAGRPAGGPDTPAKAEAWSSAAKQQSSGVVALVKELEPAGLTREALFRYALLHSPPPQLTPKLKIFPESLPAAEIALLRDRKSELKRLSEGLRKLFRAARLDALLSRHEATAEAAVRAYQTALEGDFPASHLFSLSGELEPGGPIVLVPSLLTQGPTRFTLPLEAASPLRVSVLPIGPDGAPEPSRAALARYEEVATWVLEPLFKRFHRELAEVAGTGVPAQAQLVRALYLVDQAARRPGQAQTARAMSPGHLYPLLSGFEQGLTQWEYKRQEFKNLSQYLPELLDRAALVTEGKAELPRLADPGFERWSGAMPEVWTIEVVEPAPALPRPSAITRVKGDRRGSWALMLNGDAQTNEWQGLMSEPLPVLPGDKVEVTGRMRSKDVQPRERRVTAAHLEARVTSRDGAVLRRVVGREFVGTNPWETVKLEFIVPAGADHMQIGCVLAMVGELYFDDITLKVERPRVRRFIANGGFESISGNTPTGWEVNVAVRQSQSGPSIASRWDLDFETAREGRASLHLAGDSVTSQWLEVRSQPVAVSPGQRVQVSAWMASRSVTLEARQHRHANLKLTFINAKGDDLLTAESPVFEGSKGWTPVELEAVAPLDATGVRIGGLLTMSGELWIDDVHLSRR